MKQAPLIWDNHVCVGSSDYLPELSRYKQAGAAVVSLNIGYAEAGWEDHLLTLANLRHWLTQREDSFRLVRTAEDVLTCQADGKLGVVFDIEGMVPVQEHLSLLQVFYDLGVRWMLIAYNKSNQAGGGCLEADDGLTVRGREIIDEMERVGMVLCVSHTGARSAMEAIAYARKPVILSHSNPRAMHNHPRNVSDELLIACAKTGGVVGINGIGPFLGAERGCLLERLVDHVRYTADLIGTQHVGLGLDYVVDQDRFNAALKVDAKKYGLGDAYEGGMPMLQPEGLAQIGEALSDARFTDQEIARILGENWLRVAFEAWR